MNKQRFLELLEKYKANQSSPDEKNALQEMLQTATYNDLAQLPTDQLLTVRELHPSWNSQKEERLWEEANVRNKMRRLPKLYRWMTAVVILAAIGVAIYWFMPPGPTVYEAARGRREYYLLPDSTRVRLNSGSKLTIQPDFNQQKREVFLEGEAYFVTKPNANKWFAVHTPQMDVVDTKGSTFNINAYPAEKPVTAVVSGVVHVTDKTHGNVYRQHELYPLQKITIDSAARDNNSYQPQPMVKYAGYDQSFAETAWIEGKFVAVNLSLDEVIKKIAIWYDVNPIRKSKSPQQNQRFSFQATDLPLPKFLKLLKESNPNFNYSLTGNQLEIY